MKRTVLVVDSDRFFCEFTANKVKEAGYRVIQAFSVSEGAQIVRTFPVDVVVTDSRVPHGGSAALLKQIRDFNPKYPHVIVLDADGEASDEGTFALLPKSSDSYELLVRIDDAMVRQMEERREYSSRNDRLPTVLKAEVFVPGMPEAQTVEVANLSPGGMSLLLLEGNCPVGTVITFRLKTKERRLGLIEGFAVVRWVGSRRGDKATDAATVAGVQFINLDEATLSRLQALLALLADSEVTRQKAG